MSSRPLVQKCNFLGKMESDLVKIPKLKSAENWGFWKFQLRVMLSSYEALDIVNGEFLKPVPPQLAEGEEENVIAANAAATAQYETRLQEWKKKDGIAQKFIATSIEKQAILHVMNCENSKEMWDKLHAVYENKTETSIHMLQQKLFNLTKDPSDDMATHISKIMDISYRLKGLGTDVADSMIMTKILMTIPKHLNYFASAWESTSTDQRTLDNLISRLTMEESRISNQDDSENSALFASKRNFKKYNKQQNSRVNGNKSFSPGMKNNHSDNSKNCWVCGKFGHKKSNCWHNKNKSENNNDHNSNNSSFSQKNENHENRYGGKKALIAEFILSAETERWRSNQWLLDSGASSHMCGNKAWFDNIEVLAQPIPIRIGDGSTVYARGIGNIDIYAFNSRTWEEKFLADVLYVPDLKFNLFSMGAALNKGMRLDSSSTRCVFLQDCEIAAIGEKSVNDSIFVMKFKMQSDSDVFVAKSESVDNKSSKELQMWHERMAHQNFAQVKSVLKNNNIKFQDTSPFCDSCVFGKMHKSPFPISETITTNVGEIVHADVCGPMEVTSISKSKYFLLFKDDFSGFIKVYFLKFKSEVAQFFINYLQRFERETNRKLNILRTDDGLEFVNNQIKEITFNKGILHKKTVEYTPQQNGKAERENRTLVEAARTTLIAKKLPKYLWAEAINSCVYVLNRTRKVKNSEKTPYELWFKKKPEIHHLRIFGAEVYAHIPRQRRLKWDPKAKIGILVGYYDDAKAYRVLINNFVVEKHRDVFIREETSQTSSLNNNNEIINIEYSYFKVLEDDDIYTKTPTIQEKQINQNNQEFDQENLINQNYQEVNLENQINHNREVNQPENIDQNFLGNNLENDTEEIDNNLQNVLEANDGINPSGRYDLRDRNKIKQPSNLQDYHRNFICLSEPVDYKDALKREDAEKWQSAMDDEMLALNKNKTWVLTDAPEGVKILNNRWVFKIKTGADGIAEKHKARLVVKGCMQKPGLDYEETYSPVARYDSVRTFLSIAASSAMKLKQFDVKTAFLHGDLEDIVYMHQPQGYADNSGKVCKLIKSLYGLKQSSRCWNKKFVQCLKKFKLHAIDADPCFFVSDDCEEDKLFLVVYIDDGAVLRKMQRKYKNFLII